MKVIFLWLLYTSQRWKVITILETRHFLPCGTSGSRRILLTPHSHSPTNCSLGGKDWTWWLLPGKGVDITPEDPCTQENKHFKKNCLVLWTWERCYFYFTMKKTNLSFIPVIDDNNSVCPTLFLQGSNKRKFGKKISVSCKWTNNAKEDYCTTVSTLISPLHLYHANFPGFWQLVNHWDSTDFEGLGTNSFHLPPPS